MTEIKCPKCHSKNLETQEIPAPPITQTLYHCHSCGAISTAEYAYGYWGGYNEALRLTESTNKKEADHD